MFWEQIFIEWFIDLLNKKNKFNPDFDAIDKSMQAYKAVWHGRFYLARLFMIPFLIKVICYMIIFYLGYEEDILRQTLVMIPSFFADGWLIAQWLRTLGRGEKWPYKYNLDENGMPKERLRIKGILSSMQVYVLIKLVIGGLVAFAIIMNENSSKDVAGEVTQGSVLGFIFGVIAIISSVWCYRFAWLHVPFALNCKMMDFVEAVGGFMGSIKIIGMSLICMVPIYIVLTFLATLIMSVAGVDSEGSLSIFADFILTVISSAGEILIALISSSAILLAYKGIMEKNNV